MDRVLVVRVPVLPLVRRHDLEPVVSPTVTIRGQRGDGSASGASGELSERAAAEGYVLVHLDVLRTHDLVRRPNPSSERTAGTCTQPEEPEFSFSECPAVGVAGYHSEGFGEEGEWLCQWCGARPFRPVWECRSPALRVAPCPVLHYPREPEAPPPPRRLEGPRVVNRCTCVVVRHRWTGDRPSRPGEPGRWRIHEVHVCDEHQAVLDASLERVATEMRACTVDGRGP